MSALRSRDKSAGSGFERCAATARRVAGRTPAIIARHQIKQKAQSKDWAFCFICCLSMSALRSRDKSAGSGFERCAATARRVAGRTPAIIARHQIKRKAQSKDRAFCFCVLRPDAPPSSPVALRFSGLQTRSPGKAHRAAPGKMTISI